MGCAAVSGPDLVYQVRLSLGIAESSLRSHGGEHGVVDVDGLGLKVHDATRLEATPSRTDSMKDAG